MILLNCACAFSKELLEDLWKRDLTNLSESNLNKPLTAPSTEGLSAPSGPSPSDPVNPSDNSKTPLNKPRTPSSTKEDSKGSGTVGSSVLPCVLVTLLLLVGLTVTL